MSDEVLSQAPQRLEHAAKVWSDMSDEQRKVAERCLELGCGTLCNSCLLTQ